MGQNHVWYGLNKPEGAGFRGELFEHMTTEHMAKLARTQLPAEAVAHRKRLMSERLERRGSYRKFIKAKGYRCEECEWPIGRDEEEVWGSSFELHHLTPFSELREGSSRKVVKEDFAVLCASCHRMIHETDCVSDVGNQRMNRRSGGGPVRS